MAALNRAVWLLALLAGCAASGEPFVKAEPPLEGYDRVYLYRPTRNIQVMAYPSIRLDDQIVGPLKNGGFLTFTVPRGVHRLTVVGNPINWVYQDQTISFEALGGRIYYMRFDVGTEGTRLTYTAVGVDAEQATKEMSGLKSSHE